MTTEVVNLATGDKLYYSLPPEKAVKAAYLQSKKQWDTWNYDKREIPLVISSRTVSCGDFCARRD